MKDVNIDTELIKITSNLKLTITSQGKALISIWFPDTNRKKLIT